MMDGEYELGPRVDTPFSEGCPVAGLSEPGDGAGAELFGVLVVVGDSCSVRLHAGRTTDPATAAAAASTATLVLGR